MEAGVSASTVSRVLNYDESLSVSVEKRKRILEIAETLEYVTPRNRQVMQKTDPKIALVHWYSMKQEIDDPYYMSIRMGIEMRCYEEGIQIVKIYQPQKSDLFKLEGIEGIIAIGKFCDEEIHAMESCTSHIVFVDSSPKGMQHDSVVVDFEAATVQALEFLNKKGHQKIGYLGGKEYLSNGTSALEEIREVTFKAFADKKLDFCSKEHIFIGNFVAESGYALMKEALKKRLNNKKEAPTAYFIASDSMAIGALRALYENRIDVPGEISIVGFNNIPTTKYTVPQLTTVHVFKEFMGETAVDMLMERLLERREISKKVIIPTTLIERESTKDIALAEGL